VIIISPNAEMRVSYICNLGRLPPQCKVIFSIVSLLAQFTFVPVALHSV